MTGELATHRYVQDVRGWAPIADGVIPNLDEYVVRSDLQLISGSFTIPKYSIPNINLAGYTENQIVAKKNIPIKNKIINPKMHVQYIGNANQGPYILSTIPILQRVFDTSGFFTDYGIVEYAIPLKVMTNPDGDTRGYVSENSTIYVLKKNNEGGIWQQIGSFTLLPGTVQIVTLI